MLTPRVILLFYVEAVMEQIQEYMTTNKWQMYYLMCCLLH